ncbi:MAG: hypothetical protein A2987_02650 [Omnitrophica bacterium RIFCSPLOWO2_01_FULL_45_10]|nr:MAG: hypothetical protein A2987_02650 [Omnitrophica bacterium RIFCSPLOWO2_01_FULL_45_10]
MEISEMRRKIIDKIKEEGRETAGKGKKVDLYSLSAKMGISEVDILKVFKKAPAEKEEKEGTGTTPEEGQEVKTKKPVDDLIIEKPAEEHQKKISNLEFENRSLKQLYAQALKDRDNLLVQISEKDKAIVEFEKKTMDEFNESQKERERAIGNTEMLRSKVYSLTKESKDKTGRIAQLEERLKAREKKLAEFDKLSKSSENENNDRAQKLQSIEQENERLKDEALNSNVELEAKGKKLAELAQLFKNLETESSRMTLKLKASEKSKEELEEIVVNLKKELEAKDKAIEHTGDIHKELENQLKGAVLKLGILEKKREELEEEISILRQEVESSNKRRENDRGMAEGRINDLKTEVDRLRNLIKEKDRKEIDFNEAIDNLESEIEMRDKKIESDIMYQEKVLKELNELRKSSKNSAKNKVLRYEEEELNEG